LYNPEVGNTHIAELEHIDQENVSNGIFGNKHTPLTLGSLKARNAQFNQFVENTLESLNEDTKVQQKQKELEEEYSKRDKIDELMNALETKKGEIALFIDAVEELHTDDISRFNARDLEKYVNEYNELAGGFANAENLLHELQEIGGHLHNLGVETAKATVDAVSEKFHKTKSDSDARKAEFDTLTKKVHENEELLKKFATSTQNFYSFLEVQKEKSSHATGDNLEETIKTLEQVHSVLESKGKEFLDELSFLDADINSRNLENPNTAHSFRSLKTNYESFLTQTYNKLKAANDEVNSKNQTGITTDEYTEIKDVFEYFDKDGDGKLNALDFFGVLKFLGEDVTEQSAQDLLTQLDRDEDHLLNFDEYKNWVISKRSDKDTAEAYAQAFDTVAGGKPFVTEDDLRRSGMDSEKINYLKSVIPLKEGLEGGLVGYDYKQWLSTTH